MCSALLLSFKYQGWVFCSLLHMVGKMTWEDSFLGWVCTQFNLRINYWVNLWVNWLLVAFSNPAQPAIKPILIANLKPESISPSEPNLEESRGRFTGRSARAYTEVVIHSALHCFATAMRPGADSRAMHEGHVCQGSRKDSLLLREPQEDRGVVTPSNYQRPPEEWALGLGKAEQRMRRTWVPQGTAESHGINHQEPTPPLDFQLYQLENIPVQAGLSWIFCHFQAKTSQIIFNRHMLIILCLRRTNCTIWKLMTYKTVSNTWWSTPTPWAQQSNRTYVVLN